MIHIERQLVLAQDPEHVLRRLSDFPAVASLLPNVTGWAAPDDGHFVARIRGRLAFLPITATVRLRIVERTAPGGLCVEGTVSRGEAELTRSSKPGLRTAQPGRPWAEFRVRYRVFPYRDGARVEYTLEIGTESSLEGWLRPLVASRLGAIEAKLFRDAASRGRASTVAA